jgi:hypothetical protein
MSKLPLSSVKDTLVLLKVDSTYKTPEAIFFTKSGIQGATSVTVTNVAATSGSVVATVTMSNVAAANVVNGDYVTVSGAGDVFNTTLNVGGVYSFNSAGVAISNVNTTANTFTYMLTDAAPATANATLDNFSRITVVDAATEAPAYTVVTSAQLDTKYAGATGTPNAETQYNTPGSAKYNPDINVDFIIKSNED